MLNARKSDFRFCRFHGVQEVLAGISAGHPAADQRPRIRQNCTEQRDRTGGQNRVLALPRQEPGQSNRKCPGYRDPVVLPFVTNCNNDILVIYRYYKILKK